MLPGIDRIKAAEDTLRHDGDGRADALLAGAHELWSAMFDKPAWPTAVQARAAALQVRLFRYGKIQDTIETMSVPERLQLRQEILAFCEYAGRVENSELS